MFYWALPILGHHWHKSISLEQCWTITDRQMLAKYGPMAPDSLALNGLMMEQYWSKFDQTYLLYIGATLVQVSYRAYSDCYMIELYGSVSIWNQYSIYSAVVCLSNIGPSPILGIDCCGLERFWIAFVFVERIFKQYWLKDAFWTRVYCCISDGIGTSS